MPDSGDGLWSERFAARSLAAAATKDVAPNLALPWVLRLRYGIVAGEAVIILCMAYGFGVQFPVLWTLAPLFAILASNVALGRSYRASAPFPEKTLGAIFTVDTLCLSIILGLTGGPMNPFSLLYLVQITLSAVVLNKVWTWALGILSTACFGLLFWFHVPLPILESHQHTEQGFSAHLIGMWLAFMIAAALITFFTGKISDALQRREQEVLALKDQVAKHERLASLATLAAGAAHELGTPLGTIAVVARELERYASSAWANEAVLDDARLIRSEVERCRRILERMSVQGAEPMGAAPRELAVADLLSKVRDQFPQAQRNDICIDADPMVRVVVPEQAMVQSLSALVQNALDASNEKRPVRMMAREDGARVRISIVDEGAGMTESVLRRIGEPFFTTKEPGKGMGLGTFLVRTFAERLGGSLAFDSVAGRGTTVTLELPVNTARKISHAAV
ncbi:MAG: HAMP domain-containing histidine kinase [Acidobacteriaceae bacterium]|nr:HAMP domain-containing histidine kinase [Acidobacteriaceae bacterium]